MTTIGALANRPIRRFKYGGDTNEGGAHGFSGGNSGAGRSGSTGGGSMHQAAISQASRPATAPSSPSRAPAGPQNSREVDDAVARSYVNDPNEHIASERDYWNAVRNLPSRIRDYNNVGNSTLDRFGNFLAGLASVNEIDPTQQALGASVNNPNASWGVDPIGVATTIGGMVTGLPIGSTYALGKKIAGYEGPMIAFDGYNDQSPFSNSVVSPVIGSGVSSSGQSGGASSAPGKSDQSGTIGDLSAVAPIQQPTSVSDADKDNDGQPDNEPMTPATAAMAPYPYDPLKYGETIGGWNFWPVNAADGGPISGPGDGQSDEIPALLSNGEHVIDAQTVSALGRGSNEAGHRAIEKWKQGIRKKAGYKSPDKAPIMGSIGSLARAA